MAYSKVPTAWMPNWSEDATNITVPLATFPEITAAEADAATGDIAEILYAICEKNSTVWYAQAVADRPANWSLSKSVSTDVSTGKDTIQYTFRFVTSVAAGARSVDDES